MVCLKSWWDDRRGNIAIITAVMMVPLIALSGGAVDVARMMSADLRLRAAAESGALAAASLTNPLEIETVVQQYIIANLPDTDFRDSITVTVPNKTVGINGKQIDVVARGKISTVFLGLVGIKEVDLLAKATAAQSSTNIELSLVLDVSTSMSGSKIDALKDAGKIFIDEILKGEVAERTSINLIPFGGSVNIGPLFDTYATPIGSSIVDPSESEYTRGYGVPYRLYRFTDGDNCIEYHNSDFGTGDVIPENSRSQIPKFWVWSNYSPWCPATESSVLLNTNNKTALKNRIDGLTLSDGTALHVGTLWALKTLSPAWQGRLGGDFSQRPAPYDENTLKVIVMMTDGEITWQYRPRDYRYYSVHRAVIPLRPTSDRALGPGVTLRWWFAYRNEQTIRQSGNDFTSINADATVAQFRRACQEAKDMGAVVYTIGFRIRRGQVSDRVLAECASSPGNYFFVEGLDIASAFKAIAASVSALRIVG